MATLRDIKAQIKTVANIRKITRAMQLVAAAKLNRAIERAHAGRPYSDELDSVLRTLSGMTGGEAAGEQPVEMRFREDGPVLRSTLGALFSDHEAVRPCVALITSDRGLCGPFNTNLIRAAHAELDALGPEATLVTIGRKGAQHFRRTDARILWQREGLSDRLVLDEIREVTEKLVELYVTGEVDRVVLVHARSLTSATWRVVTEPFLPIPPVEGEGDGTGDVIVEPDPQSVFASLVPLYATTRIHAALADSFASEYAAKLTAMQQATKNADEKLDELIILRNRLRQAVITKELAEIVGGAEALK